MESVRKDKMWMWMMKVENEYWGVVVAEPLRSSEEEGLLTGMEMET